MLNTKLRNAPNVEGMMQSRQMMPGKRKSVGWDLFSARLAPAYSFLIRHSIATLVRRTLYAVRCALCCPKRINSRPQ